MISFVSGLDLDSYEDLRNGIFGPLPLWYIHHACVCSGTLLSIKRNSSIEDRVRFKQDCMVGCMELFPYQFYCKVSAIIKYDKITIHFVLVCVQF